MPGKAIQFSVVELLNRIKSSTQSLFSRLDDIQLEDVEEALLYLSKIGSLKLEGGFLVLYNAMNIQRIKAQRILQVENPASAYCRRICQSDGKRLSCGLAICSGLFPNGLQKVCHKIFQRRQSKRDTT